jgi:hypothetical protein
MGEDVLARCVDASWDQFGSAKGTEASDLPPLESVLQSSGDGSCRKREGSKSGSFFMIAAASRQLYLVTQHKMGCVNSKSDGM